MPALAFVPGVASVETGVESGAADPGAGIAGVVAVAGLVVGAGATAAGGVVELGSEVCAWTSGAQTKKAAAKIGKNFPVDRMTFASRVAAGRQ